MSSYKEGYRNMKRLHRGAVDSVITLGADYKATKKEDGLPIILSAKEKTAWHAIPVGMLKRVGCVAKDIAGIEDAWP